MGKFSSISQIHWVAGLVVSVLVSSILSLVVMAATNEWARLVLMGLVGLVIAAVVGFAVRLTSQATTNQTFIAALVTAGLGVHIAAGTAGAGFDDFEATLYYAYSAAPLSGYVIFFGIVAALVATVGRRA
jgi:hypothetical protein